MPSAERLGVAIAAVALILSVISLYISSRQHDAIIELKRVHAELAFHVSLTTDYVVVNGQSICTDKQLLSNITQSNSSRFVPVGFWQAMSENLHGELFSCWNAMQPITEQGEAGEELKFLPSAVFLQIRHTSGARADDLILELASEQFAEHGEAGPSLDQFAIDRSTDVSVLLGSLAPGETIIVPLTLLYGNHGNQRYKGQVMVPRQLNWQNRQASSDIGTHDIRSILPQESWQIVGNIDSEIFHAEHPPPTELLLRPGIDG